MITRVIFRFSTSFMIARIWATIIVFIWVWARTTFPRYRYDLLINLAWKRILPSVLAFRVIIMRIIIYYIKISKLYNQFFN
jgi:NADH:ubiquinone oxidoreductase subunit H